MGFFPLAFSLCSRNAVVNFYKFWNQILLKVLAYILYCIDRFQNYRRDFLGFQLNGGQRELGAKCKSFLLSLAWKNLKQKWIFFIVIKVSFLTYSDRSFTNGVNKSPSNFLILLLLSHLRNKCILRNWSTHYWFNKWLHPNQKIRQPQPYSGN